MRYAPWVVLTVLLIAVACPARTVVFEENEGSGGLAIEEISPSAVEVSFRIDQMNIEDFSVGNEIMQQISIPGIHLPNDAGAPNLPGIGRYIAIPEGASARFEILSSSTARFDDIDVIPAAAIPFENDDSPPVFEKNPAIYEANALFPAESVRLSDVVNFRGVDAVVLGVSPFQYNPVTKELVVYTELTVRVEFEGGTGHFGEDRLRSRYWDPILEGNLLNFESLPEIDYNGRAGSSRDNEYEYVIIVPDDPTYIAWADSIKQWRTHQGIDTGVVTLTETGATTSSIESWINNAYENWLVTPPVAVLLLADYVPSGQTTGITSPYWNSYCVSDNIYGDIDGDDLPELVMARMTANPSNIETLVKKGIDYERTPVTNPGFYQNPVVACGWQTERWFTICTEVVYGFLANTFGMDPVREYAIYSGSPGSSWSSNQNTWMLVDYFGPSGLGYIPSTPQHLTDWGGNATRLNADINAGTFLVQHRDHGFESGWGEPDYVTSDLTGLHNDDLTFVFSINCLTGRYDWGSQCFTEAFHRMENGAVGLIAASEVSYSFVNDTFIFGMYDSMWPEFDPGYGAPGQANLRPGFGNAYGKHYLQASSWPYNPQHKVYTHHLFHMHGDAFMTLYSQMPQELTVEYDAAMPIGGETFTVTADEGSVVALTIDGEIVGVADGTGAPVLMSVTPPTAPGLMRLTVTKPNHYRFSEDVPVIYPVTYTIDPTTVPVQVPTDVTVTVWDSEGVLKPDVVVAIDGWGMSPVEATTDMTGEATITVTAEYGENLVVTGRAIGENYNCLNDALPVTGAQSFEFADIDANVPSIGLFGMLTPHYEGTISAEASHNAFRLFANGCGVDANVFSWANAVVDLDVMPTEPGIIQTAIGRKGFDVYLEDVLVEVVYGQLAGGVYEASRLPIVGATIKGYAAGSDTTGATPLFEAVSGAFGLYEIEGDLAVEYYDVYVSKFGYLNLYEEVFIQYGANDVDFNLATAPSGLVGGTVTEVGTGIPLEATIKVYRSDTMELYTETTSDPMAGGSYSVTLPYFNYVMKVRAYHHIPQSLGVEITDPSHTFDFVLDTTLGNLLVLGDVGAMETQETVKYDKSGHVIAYGPGGADAGESAFDDFITDLETLGYDVTSELSNASDPGTWGDYDFIISASGSNTNPYSNATYRNALEAYCLAGGKLLVEGGETGYDAASYPGYPSFAANVLHILDWEHDSSGSVLVGDATHPVTSFPNTFGGMAVSYSGYGDHDSNTPAADAHLVCDWSSYPGLASVQVYDDTPNPASGQIVYYSFNYGAANPAARIELLENTVIYLTTPESAPEGGIAGTATLEGQSDHSGIKVTVMPGGEFTYTDVTGAYTLDEMYAGTYIVTAEKEGWTTETNEGVVVNQGLMTYGVDFTLNAIQLFEACESPALAIPDNVPAGVYDYMTFMDDTEIVSVEVYVNITHTFIGDLIVEITSPEGTTVRLHNRTGGTAENIIGWYPSELVVNGPGSLDDFIGESCFGDWEFWVSDNAGIDTGTINDWCVKVTGSATTGIDEGDDIVPASCVLKGVSPNPFNPVTTVSYGVPQDGQVALKVYNVAGKLVRTLVDGEIEAGYHTAVWDGRDDRGVPVASGVYFCRMEAARFDDSVKMVLLK
jgi:subtilisin-like proprotein convertase family protein